MSIQTEALHYSLKGISFKSIISYDDHCKNMPAVLIAPTWRGCDALAHSQAKKIAELGYLGVALDLYGEGRTGKTSDECAALMQPLIDDRNKLKTHINHALNTVKNLKKTNEDKVAALGFCFGGLCVLELARSGANLNGVISIHGLLNKPSNAQTTPIKPKVLIIHGSDDPLAPLEDVQNLIKALKNTNAQWEIDLYGNTAHAFTNPEANLPEQGLMFNHYANERAWNSTEHFLKGLFS